MPGLCGLIALNNDTPVPDLHSMVNALCYRRATVIEGYQDDKIAMGCVHLGTGGQRALYQSSQVAVLFFGYLTHPSIPPGADESNPAAAACHIHDRYLVRGEAVLDEMMGAFAFALWDQRTQTLLIASDHLGLRPIYYAEHAGLFRFASEVKGILADPTFPRRLNRAAVADFFHYSYAMGDKTFFQDIQLLPPASLLRYQHGRWTVSSYWDVLYPEHFPHHPDKWYDDLIYSTLQAAVKRMVRSELRYGLSLSGGLDSRWIMALVAQVQSESLAFTVGTPGSDDTPSAREAAARTGLPHHYWEVSPTFVAELAETHTYIADGMYDLFCMEEFPLTVRVGDYVDVSVGGFLGNTLFGFEVNPVTARLRKRDIGRYILWRTQGNHLSQPLMTQIFGERTGQELKAMAMDSLQSSITVAPSDRGFQVYQYVNLRNRLRRFSNAAQLAKLPYVDIYHPIADEEVILAALQLPSHQLMLERAYRRAMASYFPDLAAIPWTFTLTPATVSVPAIVLKKIAQLTLGKWLRGTPLGNHPLIRRRRYFVTYSPWTRGPLRPFIEGTLLSPEANATGLFDPDGLRTVIRDHMEGRKNVTGFLGKALAIALWTRLFYTPSTPLRPSSLTAPVTLSE
jgi:asparagine synthase (glutamine-hydrolysing)